WMSGLLTKAVHRPVRSGILQSSNDDSLATDTVAPVIKKVSKRLLERDLRLPAGRFLEFRGVRPQDRNVRGAQACRVFLRADLHRRVPQLEREHLTDRPRAAAADVVDLAGFAAL